MVNDDLKGFIDEICRDYGHSHHWERDFLLQAAENGLTAEQLELMSKESKTVYEMQVISEGFLQGLSMEQVSVYAKRDFNVKEMRQLKDGLLDGQSIYRMEAYGKKLLDFRAALYALTMEQYELGLEKIEKEQGVKLSIGTITDAYWKMQSSHATLELRTQKMISEEIDSIITKVAKKSIKPQKGINDLISDAGNKAGKTAVQKTRKTQIAKKESERSE